MYPDVSMAHGALSDDYVRKKNFATALKEFQLNLMMDEHREFAASIGQAYTASGYQGVFKKEIEFYQVLGANYDSSAVACAYADLDDKGASIPMVEQGVRRSLSAFHQGRPVFRQPAR